jgi:hypothetical protein
MSIANEKKRPVSTKPTLENESVAANSARPEPRKRRRLPIFAAILVGLTLLVGLLPTILVHTPLSAYLVRRAAMLEGTLAFQSASLGWFSPISLSGIAVCDRQGEKVLEADRLTCDRSLWNLILHPANVGTLRFEKPRLTTRLTREGSNVASVLAYWLTPLPATPSSSSTSGGVDLSLEVADGELTIINQESQPTCHASGLRFAMDLRMNQQPAELRLSAGTLASQIELDQTACRSALKYVVPILASVTQSQGRFSIVLDGCRIPIGDLNHAEVAGRIIVHSAAVSPGPLVQQLVSLVATNPSLVHIEPESAIYFRMTGGRIYHQGLALQFPDVTMRTYGSVGLDDSLKLMVETSLPLKWFPSNAVTDAIRGEKMQIPVGGTLHAPQLDRDELARVQQQVLGNLTRDVLQSGLGNALNRLIQRPR